MKKICMHIFIHWQGLKFLLVTISLNLEVLGDYVYQEIKELHQKDIKNFIYGALVFTFSKFQKIAKARFNVDTTIVQREAKYLNKRFTSASASKAILHRMSLG